MDSTIDDLRELRQLKKIFTQTSERIHRFWNMLVTSCQTFAENRDLPLEIHFHSGTPKIKINSNKFIYWEIHI